MEIERCQIFHNYQAELHRGDRSKTLTDSLGLLRVY